MVIFEKIGEPVNEGKLTVIVPEAVVTPVGVVNLMLWLAGVDDFMVVIVSEIDVIDAAKTSGVKPKIIVIAAIAEIILDKYFLIFFFPP
jgi:hypothetical protein